MALSLVTYIIILFSLRLKPINTVLYSRYLFIDFIAMIRNHLCTITHLHHVLHIMLYNYKYKVRRH